MTGRHGERDDGPDRPSDPSPDPSTHPDVDALSAWAAGIATKSVSEPAFGSRPGAALATTDTIAAHLATCAECSQQVDALRELSALLASEPTPTMPADVFARLSDVVAMEAASRIAVGSGGTGRAALPLEHPTHNALPPDEAAGPTAGPGTGTGDPHPRPLLGTFADRPGADGRQRHRFGRMIGGLILAGALGCAGYVLSASVGLNEPTAVNPVSVEPSTLQSQALTAEDDELSPHRFSRAWRCAREVTDGTVTGIRPVVVDGEPSYLVFTTVDGAATATLVSGCATGRAKAGASVAVPAR